MDLSNRNVIHIKKGDTEFLQFRKLLEYKDVINHAYSLGTKLNFRTSTINKEKLPEQEYEAAIKSYKKICSSINCNYINLVKTNQEHTNCIKIVEKKIKTAEPDFNLKKYYKTDGLITNQKMIKEFECNPKDIICCICPSIRKCHFEVEKDVKDMFENEFKDLENINNIIEEKIPNAKWNIDTVLINEMILEKQGLKKENIIDSGICSVCNSDLIHSYRVEKKGYGLNTALISLN